MLDYVDFYDIAEYGNKHWKGSFTPKEIACNAYDYLVEFEASKASKARKTITSVIQELCKLLAEDGSDEAKDWLYQIAHELGLIDMDYQDYLETDEWLKEFI